MFNFLNTTVLIAAVSALIPLLIHLFSKRKVKIIEFSSLKHLKAMQRRQVRRLKIRQLLLLILRMLIVLLVVLAFARPSSETGNIGSHASVSAVILLDNSASMNRYVADGHLFDIAKKRTSELLQTFSESDEIDLVPMVGIDEAGQYASFSSAAVAQERLQQLKEQYEAAEMEGALDHTADVLRQAVNLNKEIYFVTDRQRHSLPDTNLLETIEASVYAIDLPLEKNDNCGITGVDFGGQLILPGHDFSLTASVKNYGAADRDDLIASLFLDGNRMAQTNFEVAGGEEASVRFTRSVARAGFHSGYVELSDDKFPGDNRYYFSFRIPERFNLLIIDGDRTGRLLSLALAPSANINQYWSVKETTPEDLSGVNFWDYDVIFLTGAPILGTTYTQRLKAFVTQGRSLFVTYSPDTDTAYFNSVWSPVTGVTLDRPAIKNPTRAGYYSFYSFEAGHPVFSVFPFEDSKPPEIKFYSLPEISITDQVRPLLRFTGDRPALVESSFGSGRVLTFNGPIDARYSDLSGHAFFVPFISRIAEYLAADLSSYDLKLYCGENINRAISVRGSITSSMFLVTPDSNLYAIAPEESQGALSLKVTPANLPGIYSVNYGGKEIDRFALNIDPAECDLTTVDNDQFARAVGADELNILTTGTDLASVIGEFRYGKELWQLFLWIAVMLFIAEILLSRGSVQEEQ